MRLPALILALATLSVGAGCGGDDAPEGDINGGLSADELLALVPEASQQQMVAVDVAAAKEAAGLPENAEPLELGGGANEIRFAFSTFFALRDVSQLVDSPVRSAIDHSLITAYAGHSFLADDAVTLLATSQPFIEVVDSLEEAGWDSDGNTVFTRGDPEELTYTAVAPGDGFLVLGYDPDVVGAVASGSAESSQSRVVDIIDSMEAPVAYAEIPDLPELDCVESLSFSDSVDGNATFFVQVDGEPDPAKLPDPLRGDLASLGFEITSTKTAGDTIEIGLKGLEQQGLATTPAGIAQIYQDDDGPLLYDCG